MVWQMRRSLLALALSVAVHVAVVAAVVGVSAWRLYSMAPKLEVQPIAIDLVKDLPLGLPPAKEVDKTPEPAKPVRQRRHRVAVVHEGVVVPAMPDAGASEPKPDGAIARKNQAVDGGSSVDAGGSIDGGRRQPGDLRSNGPEGSRVIAMLHLDRLRNSPDHEKTIAALDPLLLLLPDRRRLIDGTGLDLYRDFDSLLIATPNPADASVTFLAVRHHLGDAALRAGLDRAGKAAKKPIRWRTIDGRPVGVRQQSKVADPNPFNLDRDDRILVLPEENLAVMATPAYAAQLLGVDPSAPSGKRTTAIDGGVVDAGPMPPSRTVAHIPWRDIVARIDAEEEAVPEDAAFMMSASNLFGSGAESPSLVVPPTRGATDDTPVRPAAGTGPIPDVVTLVVGAQTPYIRVIAEFKTEDDAAKAEESVPAWQRRLLLNPIVLVSGFAPLVRRAEVSRDGSKLEVRVDATSDEIQRILSLAVNLTRSALAPR